MNASRERRQGVYDGGCGFSANLDTAALARQISVMWTTLRMDDDLYRQAKARAAALGISLTKFLENAIQERLHAPAPRRKRLRLPVSSASGGLTLGFSTLEDAVANIWCEVLGVPRVGVEENFFDLGGHSLLLTRVQALIRDRLGREVSLLDLLTHTTVRTLARHLEPRFSKEMVTAEPTMLRASGARANGAVAVVFTRPKTHRAVQLKGTDARVVEASAEDAHLVDRQVAAFNAELAAMRFPSQLGRTMLGGTRQKLAGIVFTPSCAFVQTPGPAAGTALKT